MSGITSRLKSLRERENKERYVEPQDSFLSERWFDSIRQGFADDEVMRSAVSYYNEAVKDGSSYIVPKGTLEDLLVQLPGITFFYHGIFVDCSQARKWLEIKAERLEVKKQLYYQFDPEAKAEMGSLKSTEAGRYAKTDEEIMRLSDWVRVLASCEHRLDSLMSAFENLKYTLNNVVSIRKEKISEVWVDPSKETKNE